MTLKRVSGPYIHHVGMMGNGAWLQFAGSFGHHRTGVTDCSVRACLGYTWQGSMLTGGLAGSIQRQAGTYPYPGLNMELLGLCSG